MPQMHFDSIVRLPLAQVWVKFEDVKASLEALSPPEAQVEVESVEPLPPQVGTTVRISARGPFGRVKWVARYVQHVPPHATVTGSEARFVDEQVSGPFKRWHHAHEFEAIDDRTTRCTDHITYTVGYGPFGWIGDHLIVRRQFKKMFAYRENVASQWGPAAP